MQIYQSAIDDVKLPWVNKRRNQMSKCEWRLADFSADFFGLGHAAILPLGREFKPKAPEDSLWWQNLAEQLIWEWHSRGAYLHFISIGFEYLTLNEKIIVAFWPPCCCLAKHNQIIKIKIKWRIVQTIKIFKTLVTRIRHCNMLLQKLQTNMWHYKMHLPITKSTKNQQKLQNTVTSIRNSKIITIISK